jgi:L-aspartate oxidase
VYPERIADDIRATQAAVVTTLPLVRDYLPPAGAVRAEMNALRDEMYANVGVERTAEGLAHALSFARTLLEYTENEDVRDAATAAALVAHSALERCETRGSHTRLDYPYPMATQYRSSATLADVSDVSTVGLAG